MADLIVIRIHPVEPADGNDFRASLRGLKIAVLDRSYSNPTAGDVIGTASFDTPTANGAIVQEAVLPSPGIVLFASVATAAIVINRPAGSHEYDHADLLLRITRRSGGQDIPIAD